MPRDHDSANATLPPLFQSLRRPPKPMAWTTALMVHPDGSPCATTVNLPQLPATQHTSASLRDSVIRRATTILSITATDRTAHLSRLLCQPPPNGMPAKRYQALLTNLISLEATDADVRKSRASITYFELQTRRSTALALITALLEHAHANEHVAASLKVHMIVRMDTANAYCKDHSLPPWQRCTSDQISPTGILGAYADYPDDDGRPTGVAAVVVDDTTFGRVILPWVSKTTNPQHITVLLRDPFEATTQLPIAADSPLALYHDYHSIQHHELKQNSRLYRALADQADGRPVLLTLAQFSSLSLLAAHVYFKWYATAFATAFSQDHKSSLFATTRWNPHPTSTTPWWHVQALMRKPSANKTRTEASLVSAMGWRSLKAGDKAKLASIGASKSQDSAPFFPSPNTGTLTTIAARSLTNPPGQKR